MERAVDVVAGAVKRESDIACIGVDSEGLMLGKRAGREEKRQGEKKRMRKGSSWFFSCMD